MTSAQDDSRESAEQRADIRARLARGTLPTRAPDQKIYAGYGEDQRCDCCGSSIGRTDVAYEIEFSGYSSPADTLTMHFGCFAVWVAESGFTDEELEKAS